MTTLTQFIKNIENWAEDRNLIEGSTPKKQFIKLMEEFGELCSGVSKNKIDVVKDSIGDCFVVMVILAAQRKKDEMLSADEVAAFTEPYGNNKVDIEDHLINSLYVLHRLSHELSSYANISVLFMSCFVQLLEVAHHFDLDIHDCVQAAWDEIKDRKGRMIDGVFVKEGDL